GNRQQPDAHGIFLADNNGTRFIGTAGAGNKPAPRLFARASPALDKPCRDAPRPLPQADGCYPLRLPSPPRHRDSSMTSNANRPAANAPTIAFIGGGNMARSLIAGLRAQGHPARSLRVSDPNAAATAA